MCAKHNIFSVDLNFKLFFLFTNLIEHLIAMGKDKIWSLLVYDAIIIWLLKMSFLFFSGVITGNLSENYNIYFSFVF